MVDALASETSGETRGSSNLLGRTNILLKQNMKYYKRRNPKVIALIVEIVLMIVFAIVILIFDQVGKPIFWIPIVIVFAMLIFSLFLTLSLIRYDSMRDIRADGSFKGSNLPLYTDQTTLQGHDIKDESEKN